VDSTTLGVVVAGVRWTIDVAFATEGTAAGAPRSTEVAVAAPTTKNKTGECFGRSEWRE